MRSGSLAVLLALAATAHAQQQPKGFAVERLYPSAPGGGWFVMDDLALDGGLGGAVNLTLGYAVNPLRVTDGTTHLTVLSDQAFVSIGAALTWRRLRVYLDLVSPLAIFGQSGTVGDYTFTGPSLTPAANPDVLSDARIGSDVRIVGRPGGKFRFGAGAQLIIPFGNRSDYDTDGTFRGMLRLLAAGDVRWFTWAAQLGAHIRPLDDRPAPGSPKGSELLYGVALGARVPVGKQRNWVVVVGPELWGATAFHAFTDGNGTALEALLGARIEDTRIGRLQLRAKLGFGGALHHHFGAAEWRMVIGVELFGRRQ